jgi:lysozyme family protein
MGMENDEYFERMIQDVLKHEGGYTNHPNDSGGETKFGISKRKYPHLDIKSLSLDQAKKIYYYDYYVAPNISAVTPVSPKLASKLLDAQVHTGKAVAFLHKALKDMGHETQYTGKVTNEMLLCVKKIIDNGKLNELIDRICQHQSEYYKAVIEKNPKNKVFERNWLTVRARYKGVDEFS